MSTDVTKLRDQLDAVDHRVVQALAERFWIVEKLARFKAGTDVSNLRDFAREEEVLTRLVDLGKSEGLDDSFVTRLYREIMDHSLRLQREFLAGRDNPERLTAETCVVAYQGTDGAYSHLAAAKHFGSMKGETRYEGLDTFRSVAEAVQSGNASYGVLPVENTTAGSINEVYDLLAECHLWIVGEEIQAVDHCLAATADAPLSHIRRVLSHPQALAQCTRFLSTLRDCRVEPYTDTAMAARKVRDDGDPTQAAIASEEAVRRFGLSVIKRRINDQRENYTRFFVVAGKPATYRQSVPCKTSVVLVVNHESGALASCLDILASHGLNLTKIESRPRPNSPWEYLFYVDFEGNVADENVAEALRKVTAHTNYLKALGSYPALTTERAKPARPRRAAGEKGKATTKNDAIVEDRSLQAASDRETYKIASRATRQEDTEVVIGTVKIGGPRPVIIAGPCSVESRDQIMACARAVRDQGGDILRGGCFKPRTSPYSFQGLGFEGLDLLEEAGREFDLPIVTEVLHPADVEAVADKSNLLQVGARNMQNFALLKAIGQVDCPVILKRGMMSSIDEWLSAAEHMLSHGNQQVILCERGIRTFETATRSTLDLSAVPVVRERTHLPVIVDPSHACGVRRWVPKMAAAALASGAHGVMVEIHPKPEQPMTDGQQALTFEAFERMMRDIGGGEPAVKDCVSTA
jgi:chorismate mutase/prephenate dehydratase